MQRVKREPGESPEDKDLTKLVKDRVELMKQVFSILSERELTAMAPERLRGVRPSRLQELLLDEVLGISSKRLISILDNVACPSDTESSDESADNLETISLDSISSEEDAILSTEDKKHAKKRQSKSDKAAKKKVKNDKNKKKETPSEEQNDKDGTKGMTVLELLELQARARAIRAQLAAVGVKNIPNRESESDGSDRDEVIIKEEPLEVVEIASSSSGNDSGPEEASKSRPKKKIAENQIVDDLKTNDEVSPPKKIKLNRNNIRKLDSTHSKAGNVENNPPKVPKIVVEKPPLSDEEEITFELSDTEKMDVLEGFQSPQSNKDSKGPNNVENELNSSNDVGKTEVLMKSASPLREQAAGLDDVTNASEGECSFSSDGVEVTANEPEILSLSDGESEKKTEDQVRSSVLEISDDSDDELDGLSEDPTREEIEELSRKIDTEIEREGFDILGANSLDLKSRPDDESQNTWKSRWLNSDRVKKVLVTSNLCNALRRKNKELKKKLEEDKNKVIPPEPAPEPQPEVGPDEGSVSQYQTLIGSTKYVAPVSEDTPEDPPKENPPEDVSMVSDAKQLMKMYKKLLKVHNLPDTEKKDKKLRKEKKKRKKEKKEKKKEKLKSADKPDPPPACTE